MRKIVIVLVVLAAVASWAAWPTMLAAQTYKTDAVRSLVLAGAGNDPTKTLTLKVPAMPLGSITLTLPNQNASGVLLNDGSGSLSWLSVGGFLTNPMTSPGDMIYGGLLGAPSRLAATSTANQILLSGASAAPGWSSATYPATTTINQLLYSNADNTVSGLATANSGVLTTSATGVPSISTSPVISGTIQSGIVSSSTGGLALANSSSANLTTIQAGNATAAVTYTMPTAAPALSGQALTSTTGGAMSWASILTNPMTTSGDIIYENSTPAASRLAGNSTATKNYLTMTSSVPSWGTIQAADIPTLNQNTTGTASNVTGVVALANGGTNANLTPSNGGIFYSTGSAGAILSGTTTANQILLSGASTAPSWSMATYPATTTADQLLYSSANNTLTGLAVGTAGQVLYSNAGAPAYVTLGTDSTLTGIGTTSNFGIVLSHSDDWTVPQYFSGIGVNTTSPNVKLDVNGDFATRATTNTTTTATLNNLSTSGTSTLFITSEPASFTITGFANGYDGKHLILYNKTGQNMTLANNNNSSSSGNRINTLANSDVTFVGATAVTLFYDGSANDWVIAASQSSGGAQGVVGVAQSVLRASSKTYSSNTLINDTDFSWSVGSNQTWEMDGVISFTSSSNDLGVAVNIPGSPSSIMVGVNGLLATSDLQNTNIGTSIITADNTVTANSPKTNTHGSNGIIYVHGIFTTASSSGGGTVYLQFNNSGGSGATVNSGSYMKVTRLN